MQTERPEQGNLETHENFAIEQEVSMQKIPEEMDTTMVPAEVDESLEDTYARTDATVVSIDEEGQEMLKDR